MKRIWFLCVIIAMCVAAASCQWSLPEPITLPGGTTIGGGERITQTFTAYPCPMATSELPPVVTGLVSPTDQLSQVITVTMNLMEEVVITTESGIYRAKGENGSARVEVKLLPNTLNHLLVEATVKRVISNGCEYGGYTLRTDSDLQGRPLIIQQGKPSGGAVGKDTITPLTAKNLQRIQTLALTQRGNGFVFLSSTRLAVYGEQQTVTIYDLANDGQSEPLGEAINGQAADYNETNQLLAVGDRDLQLHLYNLIDGQISTGVGTPMPNSRITSLVISPDGQLAATGSADNRVLIWDLANLKVIKEYSGDAVGFFENFDALHWKNHRTLLGLGVQHGYVWQVDSESQPRSFTTQVKDAEMINAAFSSDGTWVAFGTLSGGTVYVYHIEGGDSFSLPLSNSAQMYRAAFSPDNSLLAVTSTDGQLDLWDMTARKQITLPELSQQVSHVQFSPDGKILAVLSWQNYALDLYGLP